MVTNEKEQQVGRLQNDTEEVEMYEISEIDEIVFLIWKLKGNKIVQTKPTALEFADH